jgi:uncharacterized protein YjaG (DUF416 family)
MPRPELRNIDDYEVFLTEAMTPWSPAQRAAFAGAIAERWLTAYDTFSAEEGWGDPASLRRSLDAAWNHVQGCQLKESDVRRYVEQIEQVTPHMDDFDAEEALIACAVLMDTLRSCGRPENSIPFASRAALGVFEGLVEEWPIDPASQEGVWKKSAVRKELQAQLQLIGQISAIPSLDAGAIKELRAWAASSAATLPAKPKAKESAELTNQTAFEQYRRMVESDIKGQVTLPMDVEPGSYLFAMSYLGYWMGRYSRRAQTINGSYGRLADKVGVNSLVARNQALDAAEDEQPEWDNEVRELVEMCLQNNSRMNVLDAASIETPHGYGPSLRRLWLQGRRLGASDLDAWNFVRSWSSHRPPAWQAEDVRKRKGWAFSTPELGQKLAKELSWKRTNNAVHPWETEAEGEIWRIRINDFPDEILYSLVVAGNDAGDFHDWPESWRR